MLSSGSNEFHWFPLVSRGFQWISVDFNGFRSFPVTGIEGNQLFPLFMSKGGSIGFRSYIGNRNSQCFLGDEV